VRERLRDTLHDVDSVWSGPGGGDD
jgi:hypothetical protein